MINNFYTLYRQVQNYRGFLQGAKLIGCFSQAEETLHLEWVTPSRQVMMTEISADPSFPYWLLREPFNRKKKNVIDIFIPLIGKHLTGLTIIPFDRVIALRFDNDETLAVELYGSPNIFYVNASGVIVDSFLNPKRWISGEYAFRDEIASEASIDEVKNKRLETMSSSDDMKMELSKGIGAFNKYLYLEWLARLNAGNESSAVSVDDCKSAFNGLYDELMSGEPRIYSKGEQPFLFSLISLPYLADSEPSLTVQHYPDINDGLRRYIVQKKKRDDENRIRNLVMKAAAQRYKKNETLILALRKDIGKSEQHKAWENMGHLLTINFTAIRKGMDSISLTDPSDPEGLPVTIPLDPEQNPQANIARMFAKSKKMKQSVGKILQRIQTVSRENDMLVSVLRQLEREPGPDDVPIEKIYRDFQNRRWISGELLKSKQKKEIVSGDEIFRSFLIEGRWKVWVGQNDQKNDQLTFGYAKKDDYWFHARGVPGSHVLLRWEQKKDNPPKRVLEAVASIAAFFSKAKTSGLVPVIMTRKKYVRKMKHGRPGQVTVERESVILAVPENPDPSLKISDTSGQNSH